MNFEHKLVEYGTARAKGQMEKAEQLFQELREYISPQSISSVTAKWLRRKELSGREWVGFEASLLADIEKLEAWARRLKC